MVLFPQGTLTERIRAGGTVVGGVFTPTGIGTEVQNGKQVINVNGSDYILEEPLKAEVAMVKAKVGDKAGNLVYPKSARSFNPLMAVAPSTVIAELEEIVEIGKIHPEAVTIVLQSENGFVGTSPAPGEGRKIAI